VAQVLHREQIRLDLRREREAPVVRLPRAGLAAGVLQRRQQPLDLVADGATGDRAEHLGLAEDRVHPLVAGPAGGDLVEALPDPEQRRRLLPRIDEAGQRERRRLEPDVALHAAVEAGLRVRVGRDVQRAGHEEVGVHPVAGRVAVGEVDVELDLEPVAVVHEDLGVGDFVGFFAGNREHVRVPPAETIPSVTPLRTPDARRRDARSWPCGFDGAGPPPARLG
jgi:hypothetical protein